MIIAFFLTSLFISFSIIGYGLMVNKFLGIKILNYSYGLLGILGLFFLSIISSYTHLVFPHNYIHNMIIILFGITYFIRFNQKNYKELKYFSIIISYLIIK